MLTLKYTDEYIVFYLNGEECACLNFSVGSWDDIYSEYSDTIYDFDESIMGLFDQNLPIVNIEDLWVDRKFRGQGLFRKILKNGIEILSKRFKQFILRTWSDDNFPQYKLVEIYNEFGFKSVQETETDGEIMIAHFLDNISTYTLKQNHKRR